MLKYYKLDGKIIVQCETLMEWSEWIETADRRVAHDEIGDIMISTCFLGLDHNFFCKGDPLLFETMVFYAGEPKNIWRYFTWGEAEEGHRKMVEIVKQRTMEADFDAAEVIRSLRSSTGKKCETCGGNDRGMPCAYPSEGKPGCLRDVRMGRSCNAEKGTGSS